jgi:arsenite methyltransferase
MEPARQPAKRDRIRVAVRSRHGRLAQAARAGQAAVGCITGVPSVAGYRAGLTRAGSAGVSITATRQAGDGVHAAIIRAAQP